MSSHPKTGGVSGRRPCFRTNHEEGFLNCKNRIRHRRSRCVDDEKNIDEMEWLLSKAQHLGGLQVAVAACGSKDRRRMNNKRERENHGTSGIESESLTREYAHRLWETSCLEWDSSRGVHTAHRAHPIDVGERHDFEGPRSLNLLMKLQNEESFFTAAAVADCFFEQFPDLAQAESECCGEDTDDDSFSSISSGLLSEHEETEKRKHMEKKLKNPKNKEVFSLVDGEDNDVHILDTHSVKQPTTTETETETKTKIQARRPQKPSNEMKIKMPNPKPINNPYANDHPPSGGTFSDNGLDDATRFPKASIARSSSDSHQLPPRRSMSQNQIKPSPTRARNSLDNHRPATTRRPGDAQEYSSRYSSACTASATWEELRHQHNPFQTAREFYNSGGGSDIQTNQYEDRHQQKKHRQTHRHDDEERHVANTAQWEDYPQHQQLPQNPYQAKNRNPYHSSVGDDTSYSSTLPEQELQQHPNNSTIRLGGPSIPNSLKRKFQPPTKRSNSSNGNGNGSSNFKSSAGSAGPGGGGPVHRAKSKNSSVSTGQPCGIARVPPAGPGSKKSDVGDDEEDELPEALQHLDKDLVRKIQHEILDTGDAVTFDDIAGLEDAKQTVQELVVWPMKRPDLFTGLRRGPNGVLLFGPPGTGKTLIGKAIAHESGATFFAISSSSLTSKWIGEGEKLVRTLFAVAAYREPSVVFMDEIDSLLTQRGKSDENEASRRLKTELLVQLDGTAGGGGQERRVLVIGATNRPHELDDAARRRFVKRLYIPLPAEADRKVLLRTLLSSSSSKSSSSNSNSKNKHDLTESCFAKLARDTKGFSGADLKALCVEAAMGPLRALGARALHVAHADDIPPIAMSHFRRALRTMTPSVAQSDLDVYVQWNETYGTKRAASLAMSMEEEDDEDEMAVDPETENPSDG